MHRNRKKNILLVKVCFQSHVNMRKCYLPHGALLKCLKISIFETSRKYPRKKLCKTKFYLQARKLS